MKAHSDVFAAVVRKSHTPAIEADVWFGDRLVYSNLPITAGDVSVQQDEGVRASCSFSVVDRDGKFASYLEDDILSPYGQEVHIKRGIELPGNRREMLSLGWFRLQSYKATEMWRRPDDIPDEELTDADWEYGGSLIEVTGLDRMAYVADSRFLTPGQPPSGSTCLSEIVRLCEGLVAVEQPFSIGIVDEPAPSGIVYEESRVDAIAALAAAIDCVAYVADTGKLRVEPKRVLEDAAPFERTYPQVVAFTTERSRDGVYNAVVARGEQSTDSLPVQAVAYDLDPESPTRWNGPFGRVPLFYSSPFLKSQSGAAKGAATRLRGLASERDRTFTLSVLPDPTYEVDDVIKVKLPGYTEFKAQISSIKIPLDPTSLMDMTIVASETDIKAAVVGTGRTIRVGV